MKASAIFLVLLAAVFATNAQTAPDAAELTKLLKDFLAGAGRNDPAAHDRFWAKELIYTRSTGVRTNKEELLKRVRSEPARKESDPVMVYTAENIRIQQYGNAAVVAFKLVSTTTKPDGTKTVGNNLNTGTFIKRNGKWQVVAWQSTIVPTPTATPSQTTESAAKSAAVTTEQAASPSTNAATRTYIKGPRGGCYYVNSSGAKVYVDKKNCL